MWACYRVCGDEEAGLLALSILCLILLLSLFHHFLLHCSFFLFSLYYLPFLSSFHSSKLSFVLPIYRHLIHSLFPMLFFLFFSPLLSIVSALCFCVWSPPLSWVLFGVALCAAPTYSHSSQVALFGLASQGYSTLHTATCSLGHVRRRPLVNLKPLQE